MFQTFSTLNYRQSSSFRYLMFVHFALWIFKVDFLQSSLALEFLVFVHSTMGKDEEVNENEDRCSHSLLYPILRVNSVPYQVHI